MDTGVLDFFNKKTNPGLLFLLKVRSCVFISNFHHDALLKRVSVTYKCYEMYAHWGKKVQLLVF
jgi:hypothetical protein